MTDENPDPIAFTSDGAHWLQCFAGDMDAEQGLIITEVSPGARWGELAEAVREHQAEHGCGPALSTVTVELPGGLTRTYRATSAFKDQDGHLAVVARESATPAKGRQVAVFAAGHWASYEESGWRAPSGPDHPASAGVADRILREINAIVSDETLTEELAREDGDGTTEELRSIRDLLAAWRDGTR